MQLRETMTDSSPRSSPTHGENSQSRVLTGNALNFGRWWDSRHTAIAVITLLCIAGYLLLRFTFGLQEASARWSLWIALAVGGGPLVIELASRLLQRHFGSDLLAGISIVTAVLLGEYLAGTVVVLMLSGGAAWSRSPSAGHPRCSAHLLAECRPLHIENQRLGSHRSPCGKYRSATCWSSCRLRSARSMVS